MDKNKRSSFFWAVGMTAFATLLTVIGVSLWWVLGKTDFLLPLPFVWGGVGYGLRVAYFTLCMEAMEELVQDAYTRELLNGVQIEVHDD